MADTGASANPGFEIKTTPALWARNREFGMFATREFKEREMIVLTEPALMVIKSDSGTKNDDIEQALFELSPEKQRFFMSLSSFYKKSDWKPRAVFDTNAYELQPNRECVFSDISRINHSCNANAVVEMVEIRNSSVKDLQPPPPPPPPPPITATVEDHPDRFKRTARPASTSSSTVADSTISTQYIPGTIVAKLITLRKIRPGDEITINYLGIYEHPGSDVDWRRLILRKSWGFDCWCVRCEREAFDKQWKYI